MTKLEVVAPMIFENQISAKVIADSIANGRRLTTLQLSYPRFIHAEFMTHRVFSRNASSSRAIPAAKMIEQVRTAPARPIHWGKNQPGMQANEELDQESKEVVQNLWMRAAQSAAFFAEQMEYAGVHKQVVNRILEPFQIISVIVSATEWDNFFALRAHADAQPEIQALALAIKDAMDASSPVPILERAVAWHLPYVKTYELEEYGLNVAKKLSAARCARVSYMTHDGKDPEPLKDIDLYERLVGSVPIHASPVEHQATPLIDPNKWSGNFRGWMQHRQEVEEDIAPKTKLKITYK